MIPKYSVIFATLLFLAVAILGATQVTNWSTDNYSDRGIHAEMLELVNGRSKYGIVANTHYPNGPGYLMLPLMKLGIIEYSTLRWFPYFCSLLAVGFLILTVLKLNLAPLATTSVFILLLFPMLLPGFVYWQGALHEHSYAMSLSLLSIALALHSAKKTHWRYLILLAVGFISGWIGYDFLPVQVLVFAAMCFASEYYVQRSAAAKSFLSAALQSTTLALSMFLAIAAHLLQNTLYFDSFKLAYADLIGSAAARAGADSLAAQMTPEYYGIVAEKIASLGYSANPLSATMLLFEKFVSDWSSVYWLAALLCVATTIYFLLSKNSSRKNSAQKTILIATFAVTLLGGMAWTVLMPKHAVIHMHFVPRHLLVSIIAGSIILVISRQNR